MTLSPAGQRLRHTLRKLPKASPNRPAKIVPRMRIMREVEYTAPPAVGQTLLARRGVAKPGGGPQAAEKLLSARICECFVSGHDFSSAATAARSTWASAPVACSSEIPFDLRPFSAACPPIAKYAMDGAGGIVADAVRLLRFRLWRRQLFVFRFHFGFFLFGLCLSVGLDLFSG
jgi:hypothetical protein